MKNFLTTKAVSEILSCSKQHVIDLHNSGKLVGVSGKNGRKWPLHKVLSYKARLNTEETFIYIPPCDSETYSLLYKNVISFAEANSLKGLIFASDELKELTCDPLLFSRHLSARIANKPPKSIVISGLELIPLPARGALLELCLLFGVDFHALSYKTNVSD